MLFDDIDVVVVPGAWELPTATRVVSWASATDANGTGAAANISSASADVAILRE